VVACLSVAYPAWAALEYPTHLLQSLPTLAAMVAVGASPRPLWWRALALLCPLEMLAGAATGIWDVDLLEIGYVAIVFVSGWVLGVVLAARRSYTRALEEKTAALEAARQELAHRAVLEERTRIARDLHDILAHAMSVITVQAGVGGHLLERDPEQAKGALRVIEETGRGALGEMRRLLGVLRGGDLPTEPQPGLGSLDRRWPPRPPRPGCRWSCRSRARPGRCRPGWRSSTAAAPPRAWSRPPADHREIPTRRLAGRASRGTGCGGCASGSPSTGACSRPGRVPAASGCWPRSPPTRHEHGSGPGPGGGRPGAGQGRLRGPPLVAATAVALWRLRDA
jgi:hypothetical protein